MPKSPYAFEDTDGVLIPRTYTYLIQLYSAMEAESSDGIYAGKIVDTFTSLNISMAYYTPLFNALKELGCIQLLDRGVRGRPTKYRLHGMPTQAAYEGRYASGLTGTAKSATMTPSEMEQRVKNMERRLQGLDIKQMFVDHEQRIKKLEGGSK